MLQKINRVNLHILYEAVKNCTTWKGRIEKALIEQQLNNEIETEDAVLLEAYSQANAEQKKLLEKFFDIKTPKKIIDQINGIEDVFSITGKKYNDVVPYKEPINKAQKSQNALALIQVITEAYNQGVVLDWNNRGQRKYFLWWERNASGSWVLCLVSDCYCGAPLGSGCYFASQEGAADAAKKFKNVFLDYLPE